MWDDGTPDVTKRVTIEGTTRITDAKNVVSREVSDTEDNDALPSLRTKTDAVEEGGNEAMHDLLNDPTSPVWRTILNDESTISSNITMDTRMEMVERNIGNFDNSVNLMAHMLKKL